MKDLVKRNLMRVAGTKSFAQLVRLLEMTDGRQRNLLRVLTYHRIDSPKANPTLDPSLISATPETFERQMAYLAANCNVISMSELIESKQSGKPLPPARGVNYVRRCVPRLC